MLHWVFTGWFFTKSLMPTQPLFGQTLPVTVRSIKTHFSGYTLPDVSTMIPWQETKSLPFHVCLVSFADFKVSIIPSDPFIWTTLFKHANSSDRVKMHTQPMLIEAALTRPNDKIISPLNNWTSPIYARTLARQYIRQIHSLILWKNIYYKELANESKVKDILIIVVRGAKFYYFITLA